MSTGTMSLCHSYPLQSADLTEMVRSKGKLDPTIGRDEGTFRFLLHTHLTHTYVLQKFVGQFKVSCSGTAILYSCYF